MGSGYVIRHPAIMDQILSHPLCRIAVSRHPIKGTSSPCPANRGPSLVRSRFHRRPFWCDQQSGSVGEGSGEDQQRDQDPPRHPQQQREGPWGERCSFDRSDIPLRIFLVLLALDRANRRQSDFRLGEGRCTGSLQQTQHAPPCAVLGAFQAAIAGRRPARCIRWTSPGLPKERSD